MTFKPATRAGTQALIGLYGGSGSGKTYSALMLARGLAGPDGNVFMIDTENRRGEMYSDEIPGGYMVSQLEAPFSPMRYTELIDQATQAGKPGDALVIDSFSHEWEGTGGVVNMAEQSAENRASKYNRAWDGNVQFADWKAPKIAHKRMMLDMLGSPLHIICCLRADFKSHQVDQADYAKYGIQSKTKTTVIRDTFQTPIQDGKFIYEMTVHAELRNDNPGVPILTKCPVMLRDMFPQGAQISTATGASIGAWLSGNEQIETGSQVLTMNEAPETGGFVDPAEHLRQEATEAAESGMDTYKVWWSEQTKSNQQFLVDDGHHDKCKSLANQADEMKAPA